MYEEILNEMLTEAITEGVVILKKGDYTIVLRQQWCGLFNSDHELLHARNVDSEIYGEQNEDFWKALKG